MKQLVIALVIALALSGCGQNADPTVSSTQLENTVPTVSSMQPENTDPTISTTQPESAPTFPQPTQTFYQPNTPIECETAGPVRIYDMGEPVNGIAPLGKHLLVYTNGNKLSLLDGSTLEVLRERELETDISWESFSFQISGAQIGYFNPADSCYVILNDNLVVESTTEIPSQLRSEPIISTDFQTIYYSAEDGIRAMDLSTGVSRILRQELTEVLSLEGLIFNNEILYYTRLGTNNTEQTCFIDANDGRICYTAIYDTPVIHWGNRYAAIPEIQHPLGVFHGIITGTREGNLQMLHPKQSWDDVLSLGGSLIVTQSTNTVGLTLNCYHLETGDLISTVTLPQLYEPFIGGCVQENQVWLWNDSDTPFYCWDMEKASPSEHSSVLSKFPSVTDSRNTALIAQIQHAQDLGYEHGIKIDFTEEGNRTQGLDYTTVPDYRPELYEDALKLLEDTLQKFPKGFLQQVGRRSGSGIMQIHLVDDFDPVIGPQPGKGSCEFVNGGVTISISMCADLEQIFLRELGNAIVTRIASIGNGLDNWSSLNPPGFQYAASGDENGSYLASEKNYFTDSSAMNSPRDDQAQIFLYSMLPDQQEVFTLQPIQKKLSTLCSLIRSTYKIPPEAVLPWEQYLQTE